MSLPSLHVSSLAVAGLAAPGCAVAGVVFHVSRQTRSSRTIPDETTIPRIHFVLMECPPSSSRCDMTGREASLLHESFHDMNPLHESSHDAPPDDALGHP